MLKASPEQLSATPGNKSNSNVPLRTDYETLSQRSAPTSVFGGNIDYSFKPSDYTQYHSIVYGADMDEIRAQWQSKGEKWRRAGINALSTTVFQALEGAGYLLDFEQHGNMLMGAEKEYNNWFSNAMAEANRSVQDRYSIFSPRASMGFAPGSASWWTRNLPSIFSAISFMIPSLAAVKGLSLASKAMGVSKLVRSANVAQNLKGVTGAVVSRIMENTMESAQTVKEMIEELTPQVGREEAERIAGEAATRQWYRNSANLAFDVFQYRTLFKGGMYASAAGKVWADQAKRQGLKRAGEFVGNMAQEGAEEGLQFITAEEAKYEGQQQLKEGDITPFGDRMRDYLTDGEMWTSVFMGALGGGLFAGVGAVKQARDHKARVNRDMQLRTLAGTLYAQMARNNQLDENGVRVNQSAEINSPLMTLALTASREGNLGKVIADFEKLLEAPVEALREIAPDIADKPMDRQQFEKDIKDKLQMLRTFEGIYNTQIDRRDAANPVKEERAMQRMMSHVQQEEVSNAQQAYEQSIADNNVDASHGAYALLHSENIFIQRRLEQMQEQLAGQLSQRSKVMYRQGIKALQNRQQQVQDQMKTMEESATEDFSKEALSAVYNKPDLFRATQQLAVDQMWAQELERVTNALENKDVIEQYMEGYRQDMDAKQRELTTEQQDALIEEINAATTNDQIQELRDKSTSARVQDAANKREQALADAYEDTLDEQVQEDLTDPTSEEEAFYFDDPAQDKTHVVRAHGEEVGSQQGNLRNLAVVRNTDGTIRAVVKKTTGQVMDVSLPADVTTAEQVRQYLENTYAEDAAVPYHASKGFEGRAVQQRNIRQNTAQATDGTGSTLNEILAALNNHERALYQQALAAMSGNVPLEDDSQLIILPDRKDFRTITSPRTPDSPLYGKFEIVPADATGQNYLLVNVETGIPYFDNETGQPLVFSLLQLESLTPAQADNAFAESLQEGLQSRMYNADIHNWLKVYRQIRYGKEQDKPVDNKESRVTVQLPAGRIFTTNARSQVNREENTGVDAEIDDSFHGKNTQVRFNSDGTMQLKSWELDGVITEMEESLIHRQIRPGSRVEIRMHDNEWLRTTGMQQLEKIARKRSPKKSGETEQQYRQRISEAVDTLQYMNALMVVYVDGIAVTVIRSLTNETTNRHSEAHGEGRKRGESNSYNDLRKALYYKLKNGEQVFLNVESVGKGAYIQQINRIGNDRSGDLNFVYEATTLQEGALKRLSNGELVLSEDPDYVIFRLDGRKKVILASNGAFSESEVLASNKAQHYSYPVAKDGAVTDAYYGRRNANGDWTFSPMQRKEGAPMDSTDLNDYMTATYNDNGNIISHNYLLLNTESVVEEMNDTGAGSGTGDGVGGTTPGEGGSNRNTGQGTGSSRIDTERKNITPAEYTELVRLTKFYLENPKEPTTVDSVINKFPALYAALTDLEQQRQQELEALPFDEMTQRMLDAYKKKGRERYVRELINAANKSKKGRTLVNKYAAEMQLLNPAATIAERVMARYFLADTSQPYNPAMLSGIERDIAEELTGPYKAYWNDRLRALKPLYDAEVAAASNNTTPATTETSAATAQQDRIYEAEVAKNNINEKAALRRSQKTTLYDSREKRYTEDGEEVLWVGSKGERGKKGFSFTVRVDGKEVTFDTATIKPGSPEAKTALKYLDANHVRNPKEIRYRYRQRDKEIRQKYAAQKRRVQQRQQQAPSPSAQSTGRQRLDTAQQRIELDRVTHRYTVDGIPFDSVSSVKGNTFEGKSTDMSAANIGTMVDDWIRNYFMGATSEVDPKYAAIHAALVKQLDNVRRTFPVGASGTNEILADRVMVFSMSKKIAGEMDLLIDLGDNQFFILDIKTGDNFSLAADSPFMEQKTGNGITRSKYDEYRIQQEMYAAMLQELTGGTVVGYGILPITRTNKGNTLQALGVGQIITFPIVKDADGKTEGQRIIDNHTARANRIGSPTSNPVLPVSEARQWLEQRFGKGITMQVLKTSQRVGNGVLLGYYDHAARVVGLSMNTDMKTVYHESFHVLFRSYLSDSQRNKLYDEASKQYGIDRNDLIALEEAMADDFMAYAADNNVAKTLPQRIAKFFKDLWAFLNVYLTNRASIHHVMRTLESGNVRHMKLGRKLGSFPDNGMAYRISGLSHGDQRDALDSMTYLFLRNVNTRKRMKSSMALAELRNIMIQGSVRFPQQMQQSDIDQLLEMYTYEDFKAGKVSDVTYTGTFAKILDNWDNKYDAEGNLTDLGMSHIFLSHLRGMGFSATLQKSDIQQYVEGGMTEEPSTEAMMQEDASPSDDGIQGKNYSRSSTEDNLIDKIGDEARRVLSQIPVLQETATGLEPVLNQFGTSVFHSYQQVYNTLLRTGYTTVAAGDKYQLWKKTAESNPVIRDFLQAYDQMSDNHKARLLAVTSGENRQYLEALIQERPSDKVNPIHLSMQQAGGIASFASYYKDAKNLTSKNRAVVDKSAFFAYRTINGKNRLAVNDHPLAQERWNNLVEGAHLLFGNIQVAEKTDDHYRMMAQGIASVANAMNINVTGQEVYNYMQHVSFATATPLDKVYEDVILGTQGRQQRFSRRSYESMVTKDDGNNLRDSLTPEIKDAVGAGAAIPYRRDSMYELMSKITLGSEVSNNNLKAVLRRLYSIQEHAQGIQPTPIYAKKNKGTKKIHPLTDSSAFSVQYGELMGKDGKVRAAEFLSDPYYLPGGMKHYGSYLAQVFGDDNLAQLKANIDVADALQLKDMYRNKAEMYEDMVMAGSMKMRMYGYINGNEKELAYFAFPNMGDRGRLMMMQLPKIAYMQRNGGVLLETMQNAMGTTNVLRDIFKGYLIQDLLDMTAARQEYAAHEQEKTLTKPLKEYLQGRMRLRQLQLSNVMIGNIRLEDVDLQIVGGELYSPQLAAAGVSVDAVLNDVVSIFVRDNVGSPASPGNFVRSIYQAMVQNNIIDPLHPHKSAIVTKQFIEQYGVKTEAVTNEQILQFLCDFTIDNIVARNEMQKMFLGDVAAFDAGKNANAVILNQAKRANTVSTTGTVLSTTSQLEGAGIRQYGVPGKLNVVSLEDIGRNSLTEGELQDLADMMVDSGMSQKEVDSIMQPYKLGRGSQANTDGLSVTTLEEHIRILQSEGLSNLAIDKALEEYLQTGKWDSSIRLNPHKTIYNRIVKNPSTGKMEPVIIKHSSFPLTPSFVADKPRLKALKDRMELKGDYAPGTDNNPVTDEMPEGTLQRIDMASFYSTMKGAKMPAMSLDTLQGEVASLDRQGLLVAQHVPLHDDHRIVLASQVWKNMIANIDTATEYYVPTYGTVTGDELINIMDTAIGRMLELSHQELMEEIGLQEYKDNPTPANKAKILSRFREVVEDRMKADELSSNHLTSLQVEQLNDDVRYVAPLEFGVFGRKFEEILASLALKKVQKQMSNGMGMVQLGEIAPVQIDSNTSGTPLRFVTKTPVKSLFPKMTFTEPDAAILQDKDGNPKSDDEVRRLREAHYLSQLDDKQLRRYRNSSVGYAEIDVPMWMADQWGLKPGESFDKLPEAARRMLGYRIPNSGKNLAVQIRIRRVLPKEMGDSVIVPAELTVLMGSDFDIDKLWLMAPNLDKQGKVIPFRRQDALTTENAKVVFADGTADTKRKARNGNGVYVMRPNPGDNIPGVDENLNYGNPWSHGGYQGTIKTKSIAEAVDNYEKWLRGEDFVDVEPQRRQWILDQVNSGALNGQRLLYFKKGYKSHADVLAKIVNEKTTEEVQGKAEVKSIASFVNHSGGAVGADTAWGEIGAEFGMTTNKHYYFDGFRTPEGNTRIETRFTNEANEKVLKANETLKRAYPTKKEYVNNLLRRNWFQVKNSDAVFAISTITNNIVNGGTGWAVQMAIDENKPVYVFDQDKKAWFTWSNGEFVKTETPFLTPNFAGIGTREINEAGKQAIRNVYEKATNVQAAEKRQDYPADLVDNMTRQQAENALTHVFFAIMSNPAHLAEAIQSTDNTIVEDFASQLQQDNLASRTVTQRFETAGTIHVAEAGQLDITLRQLLQQHKGKVTNYGKTTTAREAATRQQVAKQQTDKVLAIAETLNQNLQRQYSENQWVTAAKQVAPANNADVILSFMPLDGSDAMAFFQTAIAQQLGKQLYVIDTKTGVLHQYDNGKGTYSEAAVLPMGNMAIVGNMNPGAVAVASLQQLLEAHAVSKINKNLVTSYRYEASTGFHLNNPYADLFVETMNNMGAGMIDVFASSLADYSLLQHLDISVDSSYQLTVRSRGKTIVADKLGERKTKTGLPRQGMLGTYSYNTFLQKALDNTKNPVLGFVNVNRLTGDAINFMLSTGLGIDVPLQFINLPVVRQVTEMAMNNGITLQEAVDRRMNELKNDRELVPFYEKPYTMELSAASKSDTIPLYAKTLTPEQELMALHNLRKMTQAGNELRMLNAALLADRKTDIRGYADIALYDLQTQRMLQSKIFSGTDQILDAPIEKHFRKYVFNAGRELTAMMMPGYIQTIDMMISELSDMLPAEYITSDMLFDIKNNYVLALTTGKSSPMSRYVTPQRIAGTFFSTRNVVALYYELQSQYPEYHLFTQLVPQEQTYLDATGRNVTMHYLDYSKHDKAGNMENDRYSSEIADMLSHEDPKLQVFGEMLITNALMRHGFNVTTGSYTHLLPVELYAQRNDRGKNALDIVRENMGNDAAFSNFMHNYLRSPRYTPRTIQKERVQLSADKSIIVDDMGKRREVATRFSVSSNNAMTIYRNGFNQYVTIDNVLYMLTGTLPVSDTEYIGEYEVVDRVSNRYLNELAAMSQLRDPKVLSVMSTTFSANKVYASSPSAAAVQDVVGVLDAGFEQFVTTFNEQGRKVCKIG